jgi:MFS family permease
MGITVGIRQTFGLFLAPISVDLNLGRETFAFGMGAMNLIWGVAAPFAGAVADQYGAGRVAIAGGLSYATGLAVMTVTGDGGQLLVGGLLVGLGLSGAGFTVVLGAVGRAAPPAWRAWVVRSVSLSPCPLRIF